MKAVPLLATLCAACVLAVVASTPLIARRSAAAAHFVFEVQLHSSAPGVAQLFYDIGKGLREQDSARVQIAQSETPATYRFRLPPGTYRALRFDPLAGEGVVTFAAAKIVDARQKLVTHIAASQFRAVQQIRTLQIDDDSVQMVTVPQAKDPNLAIVLDAPLKLRTDRSRRLLETGVIFGALFLMCAGLLWGAQTLYLRHTARVTSLGRWLVASMADHPVTAIVGAAVLAVVASCYPVVFCGKSFVSPNFSDGTFLLYENFPTLPGYDDRRTENAKGADVGAIMWQQLPYAVVQSRALFQDLELPLWNRYNSSGVTLLGQGQSMFGDPLHGLVLLAGGAFWAWDLKYLVAKLLFTAGAGLTVYTVTRHVPASLLLTVSAAFVGFFAFRFNHPAFFSVCYAPWIVLCWCRIVGAPTLRLSTLWVGGLVVANWTVLTSGTVKEAYMLVVFLNLGGVLVFVSALRGMRWARRKGWQLGVSGALFVLLSMPLWLTFVDALRQSYSSYNLPHAWQIQPGLLIGFFDDIFYRQLNEGERVYNPSANFLILFGCLWSLTQLKKLLAHPMYRALGLSALLPGALAFGIIPPGVIVRIPFLGNVTHIDNTFSCILLMHMIILAGFGLQACWTGLAEKEWSTSFAIVILLLGVLLGLYVGSTQAAQRTSRSFLQLGETIPKSAFFYGYVVSLVGAVGALPVLLRRFYVGHTLCPTVVLLVVSLGLMHWRHGMHLQTGFDDYVMNPQRRVNLQARSPAIETMQSGMTQPFRAAGFGANLFPGYNAALGIEGINGPDALINPYYRALTDALGIERDWDWRLIVREDTLEKLQPAYDFLNIQYFLASHRDPPGKLSGLQWVGSFDLDVYRSDSVWPRAFFTDTLALYADPSEFASFVQTGDGQPFAAIQQSELGHTPVLAALLRDQQSRHVVPASEYQLTHNTTSFQVVAPRAGVVVLTEAYLERDFHVTVNGDPVPYFRVNHAYKGVRLAQAGVYTVTFRYWPRYLTLSLWAAGVGGLGLCSGAYYAWKVGAEARAGRHTKPVGPGQWHG